MLPLKSTSGFLRSRTCAATHKQARRYANAAPHSHVILSKGPPPPSNRLEPEITDLEWEIRTGRAIDILGQTLPDFFRIGLVSNVDPTRPDVALPESGDVESIYSPAIRLMYTPPAALPPPFPQTLSLEGLPLYMASSVFIRHTMKTLYSDLRVEMRKLAVTQTRTRKRDKSVFVGLTVLGTTRVSGGPGEWQVDSTYQFSAVSGQVHVHTVDSIRPAPHRTVYDALMSLSS